MRENAQSNWDDLRFVLAVADEGSVAGAGRLLGVNHATVLRRVAAFEMRQGLRVFDRTAHGYRVAPERRALIEAMREAGEAVGQVERLMDAERPRVSGAIRITSTDTFCHSFLPPIISGLSREISSAISILSGNAHLDFTRLQADMTVRPAMRLPDELAGTRAARFRFGIYAAEDGDPGWLGLEGAISRSSAGGWLSERVMASEMPLASDSFVMLAGLAAQGNGKALLPVFLGDAWPGLNRIDILTDVPPTPVWVASHKDLMQSGRLKRVRQHLIEAIAAQEDVLMG